MGGVLIMSSSDQEYGASSDLQQLYLRIPGEVARESGVISPAIPI